MDVAIYEFSGFRLDIGERTLVRDGKRVPVPEKPFEVLRLLISNNGRLVEKDELMATVWGTTAVEENNLDKSISRLRQLLGEKKGSQEFIETVRGHGYRFVAELGTVKDGTASKAQPSTSSVRSIGVLPFNNLSGDSDNEFFCDGLAEEILNTLSKAAKLRVAAHTSAFSFKGKDIVARQIAETLGVETLLEGSVRKSGDRLRILVRLVKAADGYTIWSDSFDRDVGDIFEVRTEIALGVVKALDMDLYGEERQAFLKRHTSNSEAYIEYLKGQHYRWKTSTEDFANGLKHFVRSVELDPAFALGHFGISTFYGYGAAWALRPDPAPGGMADGRSRCTACRSRSMARWRNCDCHSRRSIWCITENGPSPVLPSQRSPRHIRNFPKFIIFIRFTIWPLAGSPKR